MVLTCCGHGKGRREAGDFFAKVIDDEKNFNFHLYVFTS